jgi:hypothetical protein
MASISKLLLTGFVWLTAAMTLVAGFPHFECRCVNGHVKPFCLDFGSATSGCCGQACCSVVLGSSSEGGRHHLAGPVRKKCCCQEEEKKPIKSSPGHSQIRRPACVKTAAPLKSWTSQDHRVKVVKDLAVLVLDMPPVCGATAQPPTSSEQLWWELRDIGPPTDLVTLFQHYLI